MKTLITISLAVLLLAGCSGKFWAGAGGGALGSAAGYEYNLERQQNRIDDDLRDGKINQQEYDIRKDQIKRDSLIK